MFSEALNDLGVPNFTIHVNDRRILSALASSLGVSQDRLTDFTVAIDKYDKVGVEGVLKELNDEAFIEALAQELKGFLKRIQKDLILL